MGALLAVAWSVQLAANTSPSEVAWPADAEVTPLHSVVPADARLDRALGLSRTLRVTTRADLMEMVGKPGVQQVARLGHGGQLAIPNDAEYGLQWNLDVLEVETIWDRLRGLGVTVAVLDSGFVQGGSDGIDSVAAGWDFVDGDADPGPDGTGHGTHVAGTVAQRANNGVGVAGVAPRATILPVRVIDGFGFADPAEVADGIIWAADNGADVINMSLGYGQPEPVIESACSYAHSLGVTLIAASGNDAYSNFVLYPAAYSTTIAVGASTYDDQVAWYSNWGSPLDLIAPGGDVAADLNGDGHPDGIRQETINNSVFGHETWEGTSMAAPHVAGVAALLHQKGITDPTDIRAALNETAIDIGALGWDSQSGYGRMDAVAALRYFPKPLTLSISGAGKTNLGGGQVSIEWTTPLASSAVITDASGGVVYIQSALLTAHQATLTGAVGDTETLTITADDGSTSVARTVTVTY